MGEGSLRCKLRQQIRQHAACLQTSVSDLVCLRIRVYARAVVAERRAAGELEAEPIVDGKPSPWLAVWQAKARVITPLMRKLRIGPASRVESPEAHDEPPMSELTRIGIEAMRDERN